MRIKVDNKEYDVEYLDVTYDFHRGIFSATLRHTLITPASAPPADPVDFKFATCLDQRAIVKDKALYFIPDDEIEFFSENMTDAQPVETYRGFTVVLAKNNPDYSTHLGILGGFTLPLVDVRFAY